MRTEIKQMQEMAAQTAVRAKAWERLDQLVGEEPDCDLIQFTVATTTVAASQQWTWVRENGMNRWTSVGDDTPVTSKAPWSHVLAAIFRQSRATPVQIRFAAFNGQTSLLPRGE